jgi:hypothetical protein
MTVIGGNNGSCLTGGIGVIGRGHVDNKILMKGFLRNSSTSPLKTQTNGISNGLIEKLNSTSFIGNETEIFAKLS